MRKNPTPTPKEIINTALLSCIQAKNSDKFNNIFNKHVKDLDSACKKVYLSKCFTLLTSEPSNKDLQEIVKTIVLSGEIMLATDQKDTVLHAAARCGIKELVEFTVNNTKSYQKNVDVYDVRNQTPLLHAFLKNKFDMCNLLIKEFGANPFVLMGEELEEGRCFYLFLIEQRLVPNLPHDHAQEIEKLIKQCHEFLSKKPAIKTVVFARIIDRLAQENFHNELGIFIQHSPHLIDLKYQNDTALMWATTRKHKECIELLLKNKADPNEFCELEQQKKMTPYGVAVVTEDLDILKLFMKHVKVDEVVCVARMKKKSHKYSALLLAIDMKLAKSVDFLLEQGADPNQKVITTSCLNLALDNLLRVLAAGLLTANENEIHNKIITSLLVNGAMPDSDTYISVASDFRIFKYVSMQKIFFNVENETDYLINFLDVIEQRCSEQTLDNMQLAVELLKKIFAPAFDSANSLLKAKDLQKIRDVFASLEQKLKQKTFTETTPNFFAPVTGRKYLLQQGFTPGDIKLMQQHETQSSTLQFVPPTSELTQTEYCEWGKFLNSSLANVLPLNLNCFILFPEKALLKQGCEDLTHFKNLAQIFGLHAFRKLVALEKEKIFKAGDEEYATVGCYEIGNYRKARMVVYELQKKTNGKTLYIAGEYIPEGFHVGNVAKQWKESDKIIDISGDVTDSYSASNSKEEIVYKPG